MAIKKEDLTKLEGFLKLEAGTLTTASESEGDADLDLPTDLVIRTKDENDTFIRNTTDSAKAVGVEMAIKGVRNEMGLEFEGKTMDNLLGAFKTKVITDAKAELGEPNKRIEELTNDLTKVRSNLTAKDQEITDLKGTMQKNTDNNFIDSELLGMMPDNLNISKSDALTLFKSKHGIELDEKRGLIFKKDGEVMKDQNTLDPLEGKGIVSEFSTPFLKAAEGGAGGGNENGTPKAGGMESFIKEMKGKTINEGSQAFNLEMTKRINDGTLTV